MPWSTLEAALPYTDLVLYDLKHLDPVQHRRYTGASNALVLENLRRLDERQVPLEIRIPLIPGINDGENLDATSAFLRSLTRPVRVRLLPYHNLAGGKYLRLGRENRLPAVEPATSADIQAAAERLQNSGCELLID